MSHDLLFGVSSEGIAVAEAELGDEDPHALVEEARARGVGLLWLHTTADLSSFGFTRTSGYARMRADVAPEGERLPALARTDYAATLDGAYHGLWGHKQVEPTATPPANGVVVGLYAGWRPIGLCTDFPDERLVDGPGVVQHAREAMNYSRLLLGACAVLGAGPVELDSWGDSPEVLRAYADLGFDPVVQVAGWEVRL